MEVLIEKTRPKKVEFISKLSRELGMADNKEAAREILTSILHTWRNNVPLDTAIQILTSLPPYLKEFFIIGWKPSQNSPYYNENLNFTEELINHCEKCYNLKLSHEKAIQHLIIVFSVLETYLMKSNRESINTSLPDDIRFIVSEIHKAA